MTHTRSIRMRMAAAAGSLALSASLVAAPAVFAQDGPEATIEALMAAIEAKDFESLPMYLCPEQAESMGGLDFTEITEGMPPGMDAQALLDAFVFDIELASSEVVSQTDTEAIVAIEGTMTMDIDPEKMGPFIEAILVASGQEVTPDMVEMFTGIILTEFEAESTDISSEVVLVPGEEIAWLVCSDLSVGADDDMDGSEDTSDTDAEAAEGTAAEDDDGE